MRSVWKDYPTALDLRRCVYGTVTVSKTEVGRTETFPRDCLVHVTADQDIWVALNEEPGVEDGYLVYGGKVHTVFVVTQGDWLGFVAEKKTEVTYHTITWKP
jgi:hypothetical protein